jgi:hypothetical protein
MAYQEGGIPPRGRATFGAPKVTKSARPERGPPKWDSKQPFN